VAKVYHQDCIALVTGTSSGIGAAVAAQLLEHRWTVVGVARRAVPIDDPRYHHVRLDLGDSPAVPGILEANVLPLLNSGAWRRIGLVNNAADTGILGPAESQTLPDLLRTCTINMATPMWLMGLVVRGSRPRTSLRIVNVSSSAAVHPFAGLSSYGSSKAALRMAGMILAAELASPARLTPAPHDFAIVSYEPGVVDTEMQTKARSQPFEQNTWVSMFRDFEARGIMIPPTVPATEIVALLEDDGASGFLERAVRG
jgi:benzil reductase ((S)-benzoin forming)